MPFYWLHKQNKQYKRDNAKDIDVVMPMCNLIEYSDDYQKTFGSLRQYWIDKPVVNDSGVTIDFDAANVSDLFNCKEKIEG